MQPPAPPLPPDAPLAPGAPAPAADVVDAATGQPVAMAPAAAAPVAGAPVAPARTAQELAQLRARRTELSSQLVSAQGRRRDLSRQLDRAEPGQDRAGIEQRMGVLDARIAGLEADMAETGRALAASPALAGASTSEAPMRGWPPPERVNWTAIGVVMTLFVFFPLAIAAARTIWRRGIRVVAPPALAAADAQRLERLEHAVDAIALEMERVSEGQRFLTRVLAEQPDRGVPVARVAPAERVPVGAGEGDRA